ncbi:zona pellucida sperm-binding protein 4 [Oncorhynchus masou masou]|uniref:zona pellucida sperm-binding protein 4 n=1 Tax=Oncorhynchus masou masou TaxID=90313 RepID=UPI003183ED09
MITLNLPFNSCHMTVQGKEHRIDVIYSTLNGQKGKAQLSCPVSIPVSHQECNLPSDQRLPCGRRALSQAECLSLGCCYSTKPSACYYSMDECTLDRHFVFSVPASLTDPPLSPALLTAAGNPTCAPQRVTPDYALFKIPLGGCGAHRYEVGQMVIYMVEIINTVQSITLNYGTITRDSPIRLLVECQYTPGSVASVGFLVKTPSFGPSIQAQGVLGVQLRIATDEQYSSFYPQYHRPLQMLLGKPLHLEVRLLNPPDDKVVLLVHYCVAYPRSGQTVWILLYNGCPNHLDPASQKPHPSPPPPPFHQGQTRRFTISTFQFLTSGQTQTLEDHEEIYFMCSTEVCSPLDSSLCVEGCFGQ